MKTTNRLPQPACTRKMIYSLGALLAATVAAAAAPVATSAPTNSTVPAAAPANTPSIAASLKPVLPLDFSAFAPDYQAKAISPPWLTVQVGTLETNYGPPAGKKAFVLDASTWDARADLQANFHPIEFTCLMGAKARYDNVTLLDLDKAGHPLGYMVSLGQIVYFVARGETAQGIVYTIHYYDSGKDLAWMPNPDPEKSDTYIPRLRSISVTQDLIAPAESYLFIYLTQRTGPQRPDSTAKPVTLYSFLVVHLHSVQSNSPAPPTGIMPKS